MSLEDEDKALAEMARKLTMGKNREKFLELVAEEDPTIPIPEVKMKKELKAATEPLHARIAELEKTNEEQSRLMNWDAKRKPLRDKGLNDEEIGKVEKFMTEKKIFDHEIAYDVYQRNQRIATPTTSHGAIELPTTESLLKDPKRWAINEAHKFVDELQATR